MRTVVGTLLVLITLGGCDEEADIPPYRDPSRPIEERVEDLLARMTPKEKFAQLLMVPVAPGAELEPFRDGIFGLQVATRAAADHAAGQGLVAEGSGDARWAAERANALQRYFVEETRLGVPALFFDEALHGLVRRGATAFPQAIALGATWDPELMQQVAGAILRETKSRGIRQVLSPVLNLARDPRWGRCEETYGEDPLLAARMGLAYIRTFERGGVVTTPKHFVANVGAGGRDSHPIHANRRLLAEVFFPPFRTAFSEGGARSVMTAYNSLDGTPCTAHPWLLQETLKDAWGFRGFVISDAGGVGGTRDLHGTAEDYAGAAERAVGAGLDVLFQTDIAHAPLFEKAFRAGHIPEARIDDAVRRVLSSKFALGLFEEPYVDPAEAARWNGHPEHRSLAREAACRSVVLLRNEADLLPLTKPDASIAVLGPDAARVRLGGYSGPGNDTVSVLEGLREALGAERVVHASGCARTEERYRTLSTGPEGLDGAYFDNLELEGKPVRMRTDPTLDFRWTLFPPVEGLETGWYSVRWTGRWIPDRSGRVRIGLEGKQGWRLWLDGELKIDRWRKEGWSRDLTTVDVQKGEARDLRVEFFEPRGGASIRLIEETDGAEASNERMEEALRRAAASDVAVLVLGIEEGEFRDRARLGLPGRQEELIHRVAALGKPVVVVLVGGSAIRMDRWVDEVDAVLMAWYPGEAGGLALADLLTGVASPSGRLPLGIPREEGQLPLPYLRKPTGRGDDYGDLSGLPLFPFGHGLTYGRFEYSDLEMSSPTLGHGETLEVGCRIRNVGARRATEVLQLYVRDEHATVARPLLQLVDFQRATLAPGESRAVRFVVPADALRFLDPAMRPILEPGDLRVLVGASSEDLRLCGRVRIVGDGDR